MVRLIWFLSFEIHPYKILFLLLRRPIAHMDGWHAKYPSHNLYQRTLPNDTKKSCFAICKFNFHIKMKKYQSKLPGAQMNPWPSLSKTLNASLISSSISVSWISLKNKRNFESCKFSKNCSPSHEPDKLIETYWAIPILVDLSNQLLKNKI